MNLELFYYTDYHLTTSNKLPSRARLSAGARKVGY